MNLRSLPAALVAATLTFGVMGSVPAHAAPTTDLSKFCDDNGHSPITASQMTQIVSKNTVLKTSAGFPITITEKAFAIDDGTRCDVVYAHSADVEAKKFAAYLYHDAGSTSLLEVDGEEPLNLSNGYAQGQNISWNFGSLGDLGFIGSERYKPVETGVMGDGRLPSYYGDPGAAYKITNRPMDWKVDFHITTVALKTVAASEAAVKAATAKRDAAIASAKSAYAKQSAAAKKVFKKALKKADRASDPKKAKKKAKAQYKAELSAAKKAQAAALSAAAATYASETTRYVYEFAKTGEVVQAAGSVPAS